ncbi:uncharacterized protein LOC124271257 isoform X5 [Haliotis rubra]|uniref:uncharacterized protein LOC124271257 isoform X5 n=1 Tax=Haliotis rubra TaxID=36100 RepID=UPI001EE5456B|nr:uncharacterized protein LOC124271257 isoform X5 [Haliotis rubra]
MTELKEKALDRLKAIFPNHCEDMLSDIVIALENDCGSLTEDKLIVRCVNQILEGEQAAEKRLKVAKQGTTIAEAKKQEQHEQAPEKRTINAQKIKPGKRMICERRITRSLTRKDNSRKADTKGLRKGRSKKTMPPARKGKKARPTTEYREEEQTAADGSPTTSSSDKSSSTDRDAHLEVSLSPRSSSSYGLSSMSLDNSVDSSKIGLKMGHGEGNAATLMKDWLAKCGPSKDGKDVKDGEDVTNRSPITATTATRTTTPTSTASTVSKELDTELQQVISIFPDVEVNWALAKLKTLSAKHPDDFLPRLCSSLADGGYQRNQDQSKCKSKGRGKHKSVNVPGTLGKIKSSQRYADVLSEIGEEEKELERFQRKRQSEELMETEVPPKMKIMTDGNDSKGDNKDLNEVRETSQSDTVFRLQCESCSRLSTTTDLSQCREGHLLCRACIEKQVKVVLSKEIETIITCALAGCSSEIRLADAKKVLPQFVVDLLQEKIDKQERLCISKMGKVVSCPDCGLSVEMDTWDKQLHCPNTDCMLASCRYCKRAWNDGRHDNCNQFLSVPSLDDCTKYPSYWDPCTMGQNEDYQSKIVPHDSLEFKLIKAKFLRTMQNYTIVYLTRIQNPKLWQKYGLTRSHILEDFGPQKLNENHLFHGTHPDAIHAICKEGFDWRLCGAHGTSFGQGSYFAVEAHYSHNYVQTVLHGQHLHFHNSRNIPFYHGHYLLLIARVVCGRYTVGSTTMRRPPVDTNDAKQRPFNSTVNSMTHPSIYVTFDSAQSYPEYILEYR